MFSRVAYESWHLAIPLISFGVTVFIFGIMVLRGITLRKDSADKLSKIPLDD